MMNFVSRLCNQERRDSDTAQRLLPNASTIASTGNSSSYWDLGSITTRLVTVTKECFEGPRAFNKAEIARDTRAIENDIFRLKANIRKFDAFVEQHQDLFVTFQQALRKNQTSIAQLPDVDCTQLNPEDDVDYLCLQRIEKIKLSHLLNERILFVKSNSSLMILFRQYVLNETDDTELLQIEDKA